ncbi:MAG: cofactor-independent phosphoglycerate mutase [Clostridiales bacterium]|jgi:2,3-bisphosphoglycerate-independent phosphoglycerate mutase|nr:cofactor-independent phosphoglycerate mutase [Clostridiales bacterium]
MKYIIVICDGSADNPARELGDKTPLEYAETPVMDSLAQNGETGLARTVPIGLPPGSDTAILSIFGYDPRKFYSGRSPLEAAGAGIKLSDGDVSYRCNMITLEDAAIPYSDKRILSHSGGSIDGESSISLINALLSDQRFAAAAAKNKITFYPSPSFRHIAVQKDADMSNFHAEPPHDHLGEVIASLVPSGNPVAKRLAEMMELAHEILDVHPINVKRRGEGKLPANGVWFWAEGTAVALPSFENLRGCKGLVISAVPLVRGIGALAGMDFWEVEGASGELDTNYEGKADAALKGLFEGYDLAVVHIEAPDECSHNGDLLGKIEAIERTDGRCVARILAGLDKRGESYKMLILSDHKTLISTRGHDGDPVPYVIYDSDEKKGRARGYNERECAKGELIEEGHKLIERLIRRKI